MPAKRDPKIRFWEKVDKTDDCWLWTGHTRGGYGRLKIGSKHRQAHRLAYEWLVGPIPEGKAHLDHLCRVRHCVNPAHLEPVTHRENVLRGESVVAKQARQTHCKRGHEFTEENINQARFRRTGHRLCEPCRAEYFANYRKKR